MQVLQVFSGWNRWRCSPGLDQHSHLPHGVKFSLDGFSLFPQQLGKAGNPGCRKQIPVAQEEGSKNKKIL